MIGKGFCMKAHRTCYLKSRKQQRYTPVGSSYQMNIIQLKQSSTWLNTDDQVPLIYKGADEQTRFWILFEWILPTWLVLSVRNGCLSAFYQQNQVCEPSDHWIWKVQLTFHEPVFFPPASWPLHYFSMSLPYALYSNHSSAYVCLPYQYDIPHGKHLLVFYLT